MKRMFSAILSFCMVLSVLAVGFVSVYAENGTISGTEVAWNYDAATKVLSFSGKGAIPNYDTYKDSNGQLALAYPWKNLDYISVTFGSEISGIGNYAFCYSEKLETVVIPDNVKALGEGVFLNCTSLTDVTLSSEVTVVGTRVFANCSSLVKVSLSPKTTEIGIRAFYRCTSLKSITLPETLEKIDEAAFNQCAGLEMLTIPAKTSSIGSYAFYSCESLSSLNLGGATDIAIYAFNGCSSLKTVEIPAGTQMISNSEFGSCKSLESVKLPDELKTIDNNAFNYCPSLKSITIPYYVNFIGTKSVGYGSNGALVDGFVLSGYTYSLAETYASDNKITFNSIGYYKLTQGKCGDNINWAYDSATSTLTLSGTGAMYDYTAEKLPEYILVGNDIKNIVVSSGITGIGAYAFYGCSATEIAVPEDVTAIGEKAIGYSADGTAIKDFAIKGRAETQAQKYATDNSINFISLYSGKCGDNITWAYDNATSTLTLSGTGAMYDYTADKLPEYIASGNDIKHIVIVAGITGIGAYAFYGCSATEITVSAEVTAIGEKAIGYKSDGTVNKDFVIKGYGDTKAGEYASENSITFSDFYRGKCGENMYWVYKPDSCILYVNGTGDMYDYSLDNLPAYANSKLQIDTITITKDITYVGAYAFYGIPAQHIYFIDKSVRSIGDYAFCGFDGTEITTPRPETKLGEKSVGFKTDGTLKENFLINGYAGNASEKYAAANSIRFHDLYFGTGGKGVCGEHLTWELDTDKDELIIMGYGDMYDYSVGNLPIYTKLNIKKIALPLSLTKIGAFAFANTESHSIGIPYSVTSIGDNALGYGVAYKINEKGEQEQLLLAKDPQYCITGYKSSVAEKYATDNGFQFIAIENEPRLYSYYDCPLIDFCGANILRIFINDMSSADFIARYITVAPGCTVESSRDVIATGTVITIKSGDKVISEKHIVVHGDVNGDSKTNSYDALMILQNSVGQITFADDAIIAADINRDNKVNSSDALAALQISVGQKTQKSFLNVSVMG
jgi:hypothetical protein